VIHTTLVGLEPATFRSLVDCWSDSLPVVPPINSVDANSVWENWFYVNSVRTFMRGRKFGPILLMF